MCRILLASGSLKGRDFFTNLVKEYGNHEVVTAPGGREARTILSRQDIGLLIINAPLKD